VSYVHFVEYKQVFVLEEKSKCKVFSLIHIRIKRTTNTRLSYQVLGFPGY
jgi:hypothetical protein